MIVPLFILLEREMLVFSFHEWVHLGQVLFWWSAAFFYGIRQKLLSVKLEKFTAEKRYTMNPVFIKCWYTNDAKNLCVDLTCVCLIKEVH